MPIKKNLFSGSRWLRSIFMQEPKSSQSQGILGNILWLKISSVKSTVRCHFIAHETWWLWENADALTRTWRNQNLQILLCSCLGKHFISSSKCYRVIIWSLKPTPLYIKEALKENREFDHGFIFCIVKASL